MNDSANNPLVIGKYYRFPEFISIMKLFFMDATNNGMRIQQRSRKPITAIYSPINRPILVDNDEPWSDKEDDGDDDDFDYGDVYGVDDGQGNKKRRKTHKKKKRQAKRRGTHAKRRGTHAKRGRLSQRH